MNALLLVVARASSFAVALLVATPLAAQTVDRLVGKNVSIAQTSFKGRTAIRVLASPDAPNAASYAVVKDATFRDGTIEVDLAGQPATGAGEGARGSSASRSAFTLTAATSTSICGPPMDGPTIRSGGITPPSTARIPSSTSLARDRRLPKSTSRTSIWSPASGPHTASRWTAAAHVSTCTERRNRASSSTI